jgi:hypothetical protein
MVGLGKGLIRQDWRGVGYGRVGRGGDGEVADGWT